MGNPIIKGRNNNHSLNKLSLNSTSTNSFISDERLKHQRKINSYKNFLKENNYNFDNFINNNDKLNIAEKNKIINLSVYSNKKDKSENICDLKLSKKIYIDNKFKNKNKLICLYTEYDSKKNSMEKNKSINNKFSINKPMINYNERIGLKSLEMLDNIQRKKFFSINDINLFYINNKASLESSKFINFDIIKERTSFIDVLAHNSKINVDDTNKNNLIKLKENIPDKFFEIEFEDYIKKLNSGEFNIDRELKERPLFQLKRKYEINLRFHSLNKLSQKSKYSALKTRINKRKNNSLDSKNLNNKKRKNKILSLINTTKKRKKKNHQIILEKIKNQNNSDRKSRIINTRNEIHKNIYLNKRENNYKTELSTSANSKFLINNNFNNIES